MEFKEIDGKKFVNYDELELRKKKRRMIMNIVFLIVIAFASFSMIRTTNVILDNKEMIQSDALLYGMSLHNFTSCQCFDSFGRDWYSNEEGFVHGSIAGFEEYKIEVGENRSS